MNLVFSTKDRNSVIIQETIDSERFLYFMFDPPHCTAEARLVDTGSEKEVFSFKFDTGDALRAVASFMKECSIRRKNTLADAEASGAPIPKELESAATIEQMLPLINEIAKRDLEQLKKEHEEE